MYVVVFACYYLVKYILFDIIILNINYLPISGDYIYIYIYLYILTYIILL